MANPAAFLDFATVTSAGAQLAATPTSVYTPSGSNKAQVANILLCNTDTITQYVDIYVGGTTSAHKLYSQIGLQPGETINLDQAVPICIPNGVVLYGAATAASKVNVIVTAREGA
jgi:hypothetical protein